MVKTVYLLCGVAGSGKSWVANKLAHLIPYISSDKDGKLEPTKSLELHDRTVHISTTIKRWREQNIDVYPIFIMGDFIQVKAQIKNRGGKITKNLYSRWNRMKSLSQQFGVFTGSPSDAYKYLYNELQGKDIEHTIYKATSPSGKVYIGKTSQTFEKRKYDHIVMAHKSTGLFAKAIMKYGDQIIWEEIEKVKGLEAGNQAEKTWILFYDSTNKEKGYNLTLGGDGGIRTPEAEQRRVASITATLQNEDTRKKLSDGSKKSWENNRERISASIRKVRSTPESRAKTSVASSLRMRTPEAREYISQRNKALLANPVVKEKISQAGRRRWGKKPFTAHTTDGKLVGQWQHQADAAVELNIPACGISNVLSGRLYQTNGYVFRYLSSQTDSIDQEIKEEDNHEHESKRQISDFSAQQC